MSYVRHFFISEKACEHGHGYLRVQWYTKNGRKNGTRCYTCHMESKLRWRHRNQRFVPWADVKEIARVYEEARKEGLHVDHFFPLKGHLVSGLHVESNLQKLTPEENNRKNNHYRLT